MKRCPVVLFEAVPPSEWIHYPWLEYGLDSIDIRDDFFGDEEKDTVLIRTSFNKKFTDRLIELSIVQKYILKGLPFLGYYRPIKPDHLSFEEEYFILGMGYEYWGLSSTNLVHVVIAIPLELLR